MIHSKVISFQAFIDDVKPKILPCKLKLGGGVTHSLGCIIGFVEDSMGPSKYYVSPILAIFDPLSPAI